MSIYIYVNICQYMSIYVNEQGCAIFTGPQWERWTCSINPPDRIVQGLCHAAMADSQLFAVAEQQPCSDLSAWVKTTTDDLKTSEDKWNTTIYTHNIMNKWIQNEWRSYFFIFIGKSGSISCDSQSHAPLQRSSLSMDGSLDESGECLSGSLIFSRFYKHNLQRKVATGESLLMLINDY